MNSQSRPRLLVISAKDLPQLEMLNELPDTISYVVEDEPGKLREAVIDADAVLVWKGSSQVIADLLPHAKRLRWIHSLWAGVDSLLFPALIESDVVITNARGVFANSLAEFVMTSVLYFAKDLPKIVSNQRGRRWEQFEVDEINGQTMAIFGYGEIGRTTATRAAAFGMDVVACRSRASLSHNDPLLKRVVASADLEELLPTADYLVITSPLTESTRGRIGTEQFKLMKPSAVLINIGRGSVVQEQALVRALEHGRIRGAALDVFDTEPLPEEHPFWRMENVLLSPHTADHTKTWLSDTLRFFLKNMERFVNGDELLNVVDKRSGY